MVHMRARPFFSVTDTKATNAVMKICIVGAGVAGLQCAHVLGAEHECHIFEKHARAGGVWKKVPPGREKTRK